MKKNKRVSDRKQNIIATINEVVTPTEDTRTFLVCTNMDFNVVSNNE